MSQLGSDASPSVPPSALPRLGSTHLEAFRTLLAAYRRLMDEVQRRQDARSLPLNQYEVLVHLSEAPGWCLRMQELANSVLLSKSGLTRLVDRMEQAGYVARQSVPGDARGVHASMTDAGFAALVEAVPHHQQDVVELFASHLSQDEAATLATLLERIRDGAEHGEV